jgi:hypothetical protein
MSAPRQKLETDAQPDSGDGTLSGWPQPGQPPSLPPQFETMPTGAPWCAGPMAFPTPSASRPGAVPAVRRSTTPTPSPCAPTRCRPTSCLRSIRRHQRARSRTVFAAVDLTSDGYVELFTAQWIHRLAGLPALETPTLRTNQVFTDAQLRDWQAAWHGGDGTPDVFRPALLDDPVRAGASSSRRRRSLRRSGSAPQRGAGRPLQPLRGR